MLTDKEKKTLVRTEKDLDLPKWKYVLLYGLTFAILCAITSVLYDMIFDHISFSDIIGKRIWTYIRPIPIAAVLFGLAMRWIYSRQVRILKKKENSL